MKIKGRVNIWVILFVVLPAISFASVPLKTDYPVLSPIENTKPNGDFGIFIYQSGKWQEVAKRSYDKYFREQTLNLAQFLTDESEPKVRLVQRGGGVSHIDSVFLGEKPSERANSPDGKTYKRKHRLEGFA